MFPTPKNKCLGIHNAQTGKLEWFDGDQKKGDIDLTQKFFLPSRKLAQNHPIIYTIPSMSILQFMSAAQEVQQCVKMTNFKSFIAALGHPSLTAPLPIIM